MYISFVERTLGYQPTVILTVYPLCSHIHQLIRVIRRKINKLVSLGLGHNSVPYSVVRGMSITSP